MKIGWLRGSFFIGKSDTGGTVTGRLSSDLQQIPRQGPDTPPHLRIKDLIVAPEGYLLLAADYSQIELRVAAWIAREPAMLAAFREDRDLHTETARDILRVAEPTRGDRQKAKSVNFGFLYKMGAQKFVRYAFVEYNLRFSLEEAQGIRTRYLRKFAGLPAYYMRQEAELRRYGQVRTPLGRIRRLPGINASDKDIREEAIRQAINTPVQSVASDLNSLAIIEAYKKMPTGTKFLLPYHDASLWLVPQVDAQAAADVLIEAMETAVPALLPRRFGIECPIPLKADAGIGPSWGLISPLTKRTPVGYTQDLGGEPR